MRILTCIFAYNEGERIKQVIDRYLKPRSIEHEYDIMIVDDGTTDGSLDDIPKNIKILRNKKNMGIGYAMKQAFQYTIDNKYDIITIIAGNDKDNPREIPDLVEPILNDDTDFVQGSRFIQGGVYGNMPLYRIVATKIIHPLLCSLISGKRLSESTNGFRAFKVSILKDIRIDWHQKWLDRYELEPYLLIKTIQCGYKHMEVPCMKIYPQKSTTKMNILSWWHMLKPIVYLGLGIKK